MRNHVYHLECQCTCPFHTVRLEYDEECEEKTIQVFLCKYQSFFKRLKMCFYYLFFSKDIDYDVYMLNPSDKDKFLEWLCR